MTTFDIMLPYYGSVPLMQAAVRSVLAQSDPDWRLTVVDDGKEPGVPEWFAGLGDERVRYRRNERNLGVSGNYRKCVSLVEFDRVVLMGTDDIMLPNYLAAVRRAISVAPDAAMVQPGVEVIDGDGKPVKTLVDETKRRVYAPKVDGFKVMAGEELAASLIGGNWLYFPSMCWRADALEAVPFRDDLQVTQDLALVLDLLLRDERMVVAGELCFQYRRHAASISSAQAYSGARFNEERRFFLETAEAMEARGWPRAAKVARLHVASRLHALTLLPGAVKTKQKDSVSKIFSHVFGPVRRAR
ncbi:glycosyltransferase family 2 protein [Streptomyces sp. SID3343]|uniref:glycosyltransferase family 2 protein n=1 Tax=Streptomyces sp. SID3343 TaxID=2690260 RepID=UPI00136B9907|nr:glycosyltransferase family 2 protein [Streptomyces sp. SID3343]MYW01595.1 glycosyltransferase [Streptomyces sp. SID3343]